MARAHGVRPGHVALAWLLAQGQHVLPIPGSTDPEHVAANAGAAHLRLTPEDLEVLAGDSPLPQDRDAIVLEDRQTSPAP